MTEYQMANTRKIQYRVGIDPDLTASGVAVMCNGVITELHTMPFFELMDFIQHHKTAIFSLENVNANKSLYAKHDGKPALVKMRIAQNVGMCKAIGTLIQQKLEREKCIYELVTPLKGTAKKAKTDAKLFNKLTGWEGRSNADNRDAAMLLFRYMNKLA